MAHNKQIQQALKGFGFYHGRIDGILGEATADAICKFQRINPPLVVDGKAGTNTLAELFPESFERKRVKNPYETLAQEKYPFQKDMKAFYGTGGTRQSRANMPCWLRLAWDLDQHITSFTCHELLVEPIEAMYKHWIDHYGIDEFRRLGLDLFGGCYNLRPMRGSNQPSVHGHGAAIDTDPIRNKLRWGEDKAEFAKPIYNDYFDIAALHGATSLGRTLDKDYMHIQFARV